MFQQYMQINQTLFLPLFVASRRSSSNLFATTLSEATRYIAGIRETLGNSNPSLASVVGVTAGAPLALGTTRINILLKNNRIKHGLRELGT